MRMFLKTILQGEGFELDEAADGIQALAKCLGATPPDIILMDMVMPNMDGLECCRKIKDDKLTKHIPVIMVTTMGESRQKVAAVLAGCDAYVTKPVDKSDLMSKIRRLLSK